MAARSLSIVRYRPLRATPRVWARLTQCTGPPAMSVRAAASCWMAP